MLGGRPGAAREHGEQCFVLGRRVHSHTLDLVATSPCQRSFVLLFCVCLSGFTANPREEKSGRLTCHDVCPDVMYHTQFRKPSAVEDSSRGKRHFKKFQKQCAINLG